MNLEELVKKPLAWVVGVVVVVAVWVMMKPESERKELMDKVKENKMMVLLVVAAVGALLWYNNAFEGLMQ
jgi:NADH:ubiquinone oxidoreductase subunit 6 (subunit J)